MLDHPVEPESNIKPMISAGVGAAILAEALGMASGHLTGSPSDLNNGSALAAIPGVHGYHDSKEHQRKTKALGGARSSAASEDLGGLTSTLLLAAASAGIGAFAAHKTNKDVLTTAAKAGFGGVLAGGAANLTGLLAGMYDKSFVKGVEDYRKYSRSGLRSALNYLIPGAAFYNSAKYDEDNPVLHNNK